MELENQRNWVRSGWNNGKPPWYPPPRMSKSPQCLWAPWSYSFLNILLILCYYFMFETHWNPRNIFETHWNPRSLKPTRAATISETRGCNFEPNPATIRNPRVQFLNPTPRLPADTRGYPLTRFQLWVIMGRMRFLRANPGGYCPEGLSGSISWRRGAGRAGIDGKG